jgi:hypothetical protein
MSTITADPVPSTDDVPVADDPVLGTLLTARARFEAGAMYQGYWIGTEVCAIGSLFAAEMERPPLEAGICDPDDSAYPYNHLEKYLSEAAQEAARLLDEAAVALYPETRGYENGSKTHLGARIEDVNQFVADEDKDEFDFKQAVLNCYDAAIIKRVHAQR